MGSQGGIVERCQQGWRCLRSLRGRVQAVRYRHARCPSKQPMHCGWRCTRGTAFGGQELSTKECCSKTHLPGGLHGPRLVAALRTGWLPGLAGRGAILVARPHGGMAAANPLTGLTCVRLRHSAAGNPGTCPRPASCGSAGSDVDRPIVARFEQGTRLRVRRQNRRCSNCCIGHSLRRWQACASKSGRPAP